MGVTDSPSMRRAQISLARQRVLGMYRVELLDAPSEYRALRETFCVYEEAGRVTGQYTGGMPRVLRKEANYR